MTKRYVVGKKRKLGDTEYWTGSYTDPPRECNPNVTLWPYRDGCMAAFFDSEFEAWQAMDAYDDRMRDQGYEPAPEPGMAEEDRS